MIFRDDFGYLSERSGDGGDSAVRAGLMGIYTGQPDNLPFYVKNGQGMRHPLQTPWNNPKNFTKDQLKCLVAGLVAIGRIDLVREIVDHHKKLKWCQNTERDASGSTKLMRPHAFYKDSKRVVDGKTIIDPITVPMPFSFSKFRFVVDESKLDVSQTIETKNFDHCDPLLPNDWEFLNVAARYKEPGGLGMWWHHQSLCLHAKSDHNEENQMFAECYVLRTMRDFVNINKRWQERDQLYWFERDEIEYHTMKLEFVAKQIHSDFLIGHGGL